jgi:hypothetical protein
MAMVTAVFLLSAAMVLQNSIISRLHMLQGSADLVLLVLVSWILLANEKGRWLWGVPAGLLVGISSAIPFWIPVISYTGFALIVTRLQQRIWQVPIWMLVTSTFFGTILIIGLEVIYLWLTAIPIGLTETLNLILLPSLVLNMIAVLPVYGLVGEVTKRLYPKEDD